MAEVIPFRAFHYADALKKELPRLVCPPYDVISSEERKRLAARHKTNFVRVELPAGSAGSKYDLAAKIWKSWVAAGVLDRDGIPSFYLYEAAFRSPRTGKKLVRRGFFGALKTVPWGQGVYPHEKTLPTHKADRLNLFKSVHVQTSPIQCLFDDRSGKAQRLIDRAAKAKPWVDYTDAGVRHRVWRLRDESTVAPLRAILRRAPVMIADGHHRYETSLNFSRWAKSQWGAKSPLSGYVMTYFSPVDEPGLEIHPTHRAVGWDKRRFVNLEKWGKLTPVKGLKALAPLMEGKDGKGLAVGLYHDGKFYRYEITKTPPALKGTPSAKLVVACLHAGPLFGLGKEDFAFSQKPEAVVRAAKAQQGWGFFLAPTDLRQVIQIATAGQVMPPKSTYFFPKIPSGLLAHSLAGSLD